MDLKSIWGADFGALLWQAFEVGRLQELPAQVAILTIVGSVVGIVFLMASILLLHVYTSLRLRRGEQLRIKWLACLLNPDHQASELVVTRRDLDEFMKIWSQLLESLRGDYRDALVAFVRDTKIPGLVRHRMVVGRLREKLMCIRTIGSLKDDGSRQLLADFALRKDPFLSLEAATAMLSINASESLEMLIPHFIERGDWPLSRVHAALSSADPGRVSQQLVEFLMEKMPKVPLRSLRLLGLIKQESRSMLIRTLFVFQPAMAWEEEVALLDAIHDPLQVDLVREQVHHPAWQVVVAALKAVSRVGDLDDVPMLLRLMEHSQWWVRYRAAQAIANLPGLKPIQVELYAVGHRDPFARDMLRFALAEHSLK